MLRAALTRPAIIPQQRATICALSFYNFFHSTRIASNQRGGQKTPIQVFIDTFRSEIKKSEDLQHNIKALQDETGKMSESDAYKKAKEAYEAAKKGTSATGEVVKKAGKIVGEAAVQAWDSPVGKTTRHVVNATSESVSKATEPIRKTQAYQDIKEVIDDGDSSMYGGFDAKDVRHKKREAWERKKLEEDLKRGIRSRPVKENLEAGQSVITHGTAKPSKPTFSEKWEHFKVTTSVGRFIGDMRLKYEESENGLVSGFRTVSGKIVGFFSETESGRVIRKFKQMDPSFNMDDFQREVRQFILPEILDAYIKGDKVVLKAWLSEAPYNVWEASAKQYVEQGLVFAGRILDIRGVDILSSKMLPPNEIPVFVIGCRAQEIQLYKKAKTNEIVAGAEDHVQMSSYAMVLTRLPEEIDNEETKGWRVLELVRGQSREWN